MILTSVEFDHADIYRDLDHLKSAFARLIDIIPADGSLIVCSDYPAAMRSRGRGALPAGDLRWWRQRVDCGQRGISRRPKLFRTLFSTEIRRPSRSWRDRHAQRQKCFSSLRSRAKLGIDRAKLLEGFATFAGVKRRQEIRGERRGVLVIDDFAHHPTAVRETIDAVSAAYAGRRLWAIFEPRSNTSKRNIFEREFAHALARADRTIVAGVYQPEKIPESERLSVPNVIAEINRCAGEGAPNQS